MMANPSNSWWRIMSSSSPIPQQEQEEANNSSDLFSSSHQHHHHPQLVLGDLGVGSSSSNYSFSDNNPQELPNSWSQLLLGGLTGEEDKFGGVVGHFQPFKKLENWEDQILNPLPIRGHDHDHHHDDHAKQEQEASQNRSDDQDLHHFHSNITMPVSSPRSCVTTSFSSNNYTNNSKNNSILDFSNNKAQDHSYECNSTATGGVCKKARVNPSSSSQPPLKVRKEKLGDRLTALHQLVSPFGKRSKLLYEFKEESCSFVQTDTASVLLEAIGYIRFLQCQIQTLSNPYLGNSSGNMRTQDSVNGGGRNGALEAEMQMGSEEKVKDLRSKGLCLVPVSCTQQVGSDNGADYWAPAFGSGGGF